MRHLGTHVARRSGRSASVMPRSLLQGSLLPPTTHRYGPCSLCPAAYPQVRGAWAGGLVLQNGFGDQPVTNSPASASPFHASALAAGFGEVDHRLEAAPHAAGRPWARPPHLHPRGARPHRLVPHAGQRAQPRGDSRWALAHGLAGLRSGRTPASGERFSQAGERKAVGGRERLITIMPLLLLFVCTTLSCRHARVLPYKNCFVYMSSYNK
jgi:hypothetical protein